MLSGDRIKFLRFINGRTLTQVADWANISKRYLIYVEAGDMIPSEETYQYILNGIYQTGPRAPKTPRRNTKAGGANYKKKDKKNNENSVEK